MKKIVLFTLSLVLSFSFGACTRENLRVLSPVEVKTKVDSLTAVKVQQIKAQAKEDLDVRIAIEVKPKADSIVYARKHPHAEQAKKNNMPVPLAMPKQLIPMGPLHRPVNK